MAEEKTIYIAPLEKLDLDSAELSGSAFFGYNRWRVRLSGITVNPEEASIIKQIFTDFIKGLDKSQIAKKLNKAGKRTKKGKRWTSKYVNRILLNSIYCGYVFCNGKYIRGIYHPIISVQEFNACQEDESTKITL